MYAYFFKDTSAFNIHFFQNNIFIHVYIFKVLQPQITLIYFSQIPLWSILYKMKKIHKENEQIKSHVITSSTGCPAKLSFNCQSIR